MTDTPAARPLLASFGTLVSQTWNNYRAHLKMYVPIGLIGMLVSFIGAIVVSFSSSGVTGLASEVVFSLLGVVVEVLASAALIYAVIHSTETSDFRQAFSKSMPDAGRWVWTTFLFGLIVTGGTILFIIPGIIWSITYMFAAYLVYREHVSGGSALRRSKELTNARWFDVFWRTLVFFFCLFIINVVVTAIVSAITSHIEWIDSIASDIMTALIAPLGVIFLHYLYESLVAAKSSSSPAPTTPAV